VTSHLLQDRKDGTHIISKLLTYASRTYHLPLLCY